MPIHLFLNRTANVSSRCLKILTPDIGSHSSNTNWSHLRRCLLQSYARFKQEYSHKNHSKSCNKIKFATLLSSTALYNNDTSLLGPATQPEQRFRSKNQNQNLSALFTSNVIDWNVFSYGLLARGEVDRIVIDPTVKSVTVFVPAGATVMGNLIPFRVYTLNVPNIDLFEERLREFENSMGIAPENQVPITYHRPSVTLPILMGLGALAFLAYYFRGSFQAASSSGVLGSFGKANFTLVDPTTKTAGATRVTFRDVAGLHEAKVEVREFVDYLKSGEKFLHLGAKLPKGALLTGPPGCGKTLLAKAVAYEANVPFLALSGSDFMEMIGGVGASRVRSLFKTAKKLAPCIIYIDEIDSIGRQRGGSQFTNSESDQTLNQLLVEMDGMIARKSIIVMASTNRADVLDKALLRPGRFDRQILIDLPNLSERREIFEKHASAIKLEKSASEYSHRMAQLTPGMSGADLANICNEAALHAAREQKSVVEQADLEYAIERVIGGAEKKSTTISNEERRTIAFHESGHALVGWLLEGTDPVLKVSIVPRIGNVLGFAQYVPSDNKLHSPDQLFDRMCVALGGRVAELLKFNKVSTGAQDDLQRVTKLAHAQVSEFGFDPAVGNISFAKEEIERLGKRPYSKQLANLIDQRASLIVRRAFERTQEILAANMDKLNLLAEALLNKEVLNSADIEQIIGPRPHAKKSDL